MLRKCFKYFFTCDMAVIVQMLFPMICRLSIIVIAVCAKWSTGLGEGLLIALSFAYGLKQIDQNYKNRQENFERIHRHDGSHVPVWTLS